MSKKKRPLLPIRSLGAYPAHNNVEAYVKAFCERLGHVKTTYIINGKKVIA